MNLTSKGANLSDDGCSSENDNGYVATLRLQLRLAQHSLANFMTSASSPVSHFFTWITWDGQHTANMFRGNRTPDFFISALSRKKGGVISRVYSVHIFLGFILLISRVYSAYF